MIAPEADGAAAGEGRRGGHSLAALALGVVHPVVLTFILGAVFSYLTGDTVRAGYLMSVGLALAWDHAWRRWHPAGPRASDSAQRRRAAMDRLLLPVVCVGVVFAVGVGSLRRYSWPATILVTAVAAVSVVAAWALSTGSPGPRRRLGRAGVTAWSLVWAGAAGWELTSLFLQPALTTSSYAHPTLSNLMDPVLASSPGRAAVLFGWLTLGWYLARR